MDNNVTRNVPGELERDDWDAMILHYLGLDHIGHKSGPNSSNMIPKQKEMDGIVEQIYKAINTRPHHESTLFVLCGDHGMNDGGNHGGSAAGETSPALVFISPKFKDLLSERRQSPVLPLNEFDYHSHVEQPDIVPTISSLMGFPIPRNNLGIVIPEFLELWEDGLYFQGLPDIRLTRLQMTDLKSFYATRCSLWQLLKLLFLTLTMKTLKILRVVIIRHPTLRN